MAKKQTRRSISVSRTTYERLKAFCESNNISMSQLVETRVNARAMAPMAPRAMPTAMPARPMEARPASTAAGSPATTAHAGHTGPAASSVPMTSAAARFAVEPPLPIIKPRQDTAAPKPAEKRPEQIFTF